MISKKPNTTNQSAQAATPLPTYNVKAVIHETGLTPAVLRAWERRYGLLKPQRSAGGHRIYTQDEVDTLKWLAARQAEGLSISHAVELWRYQEQSSPLPAAVSAPGGDMLDQLRGRWIEACLAFDEPVAEQALAQALAIASPEFVCRELLQKGLAELGERWYAGTVNVQQEHFASSLAMRRLQALLAAAPIPARPGRLLAACPPGESHELALLMLAFNLRWRGWDVVYLGADVPLASLDATLQTAAPRLVLSTAQTLPAAAALGEMAAYTRDHGIPLAFGGGIFSHIETLSERIPGYFLGHTLAAAPQIVEGLLASPLSQPAHRPISPVYTTALAGFKEKEALIIASVNALLLAGPIAPRYLDTANIHLTRAIAAALTLGEIGLLDYSTGWLNGLLENYGLPPALAPHYYSVYCQAVQQQLGSQAAVIVDWLSRAAMPG